MLAYECACGWRCGWQKSLDMAACEWNFRIINRALYEELLFAVGNKYKDETRHEAALRYIRER